MAYNGPLWDVAQVTALGTPGLTTNGGTFGAPGTYWYAGVAEYHNVLLTGSFGAATGTVNVFQGTNSGGSAAKIVTGATLVGTASVGTAWSIVVKADQLDTVNGFTWLNAVGTVASGGSAWVSLSVIRTDLRVARGEPGTSTTGLNGSTYVVN